MGEITQYVGDPWDRQLIDGEPEDMMWFMRFDRFFRPQGSSRSLMAAYNAWRQTQGRGPASGASMHWIQKAKDHKWRERAEAWDEVQRQKRLRLEEEERVRMRERHVKLGTNLQVLGGKGMQRIKENPDMLSPAETRRYIKEGIGIERQARGMPEYLIQVAQMTDDELFAKYNQLIERIEHTGSGAEAPRLEAPDADE